MAGSNSGMDAQRFKLIREIFFDAQRFRGRARAAFLDQRCGADRALKDCVSDLLRHDDSSSSVIDRPLIRAIDSSDASGATKRRFGTYEIQKKIGSGAAERRYAAASARKIPVCLSLVRPELRLSPEQAKQVCARIEEAFMQLAGARWRAFPRLLEAGVSPDAVVYAACELVAGEPIFDYCDRVRATVRSRLLLFLDACEAIESANSVRVIHAGLEPGNVLVRLQGDVPTVLILGFGIAGAFSSDADLRRTWQKAVLAFGAPECLSPEQAGSTFHRPAPTDDVYALGVILYELLSGKAPFDRRVLVHGGVQELAVRLESDIVDPSSRIRELNDEAEPIALNRGLTPRELASELAKGPGYIAMKAMAAAPADRYASARALADDIRNFLDNKAISASADSLQSRVRKFVERLRHS
jgi:serine/threonine-protein kinase